MLPTARSASANAVADRPNITSTSIAVKPPRVRVDPEDREQGAEVDQRDHRVASTRSIANEVRYDVWPRTCAPSSRR